MLRSFIVAATTALCATAVSAADVTITTYGDTATVPQQPPSVAVFDMASLDMLDALEIKGITSTSNTYLPYLEEYQGEIGTLFEPDFEALAATGPGLIIAGGRSSTQVDALSKIAPTVDMTLWGDDLLGQTRDRLTAYGKIFDKEEEAASLIANLDTELEATKKAVAGKGTALILLTNGGKISAYGAGGRFGWLHQELDLAEAVDGLEDTTHGESISFEFVREADPDWILVLDRVAAIGAEGESAAATLDNAIIADTTAAQKGQIVHLNSGGFYIASGGIQSTLETLDIIKSAFGSVSGS
ncbi:siderophore ABC transporter substrate-binding protein [Halocynthiibacter sp. C4]|uniref:siderophore ABC transporter substrate-binding protein n=1 Tax=Halocynthiibacter sp. C4 TaxID=2992758 RepID=UPI00237B574F|nr:siderophore ABC transporter substrate-binding protein [Halocynthiibacter sp. C4]MDE0591453.1 siderophore ABC transporter substrate-binding protein [Halocynthiibacter sp. C4]